MNIKKHIPNFLTCCNLICGCIGIVTSLYAGSFNELVVASYLIFAACVFDFFDGFIARVLHVSSPIGKELDSLADVVTFGVLPGIIILKLLEFSILGIPGDLPYYNSPFDSNILIQSVRSESFFSLNFNWIKFIFIIIPVFSALRLAKFNIDTRQSESFIGVPTPANAILIASLPIILNTSLLPGTGPVYPDNNAIVLFLLNPYFLISLSILMSFLLVAELPLFALKFKTFRWAGNQVRYVFLIASIFLFVFLTWTSIPLIIFLYILLSLAENIIVRPKNS